MAQCGIEKAESRGSGEAQEHLTIGESASKRKRKNVSFRIVDNYPSFYTKSRRLKFLAAAEE